MENELIETVILVVVLAICIYYMVRKAIARFSKSGHDDYCDSCSGCSLPHKKTPCDSYSRKNP